MARRTEPGAAALATRERILAAAVRQFASRSFEDAGLREIAAAARVDVAHVHRSFGSKERLFAEAVRASVAAHRIGGPGEARSAAALAREALRAPGQDIGQDIGQDAGRDIGPFHILCRSLCSPQAAAVLRDCVDKDVMEPVARSFPQAGPLNIALVAALLAGTGILRNVLRLDSLADADVQKLEHLLCAVIEHMLDGGTPSPPETER